jgi:hypothetical protein
MKIFISSFLFLFIFSCKNDTTITDDIKSSKIDTVNAVSIKTEKEEPEAKYDYSQDWRRFKIAVQNKNIKEIASFASSDNIDSEYLLQSLSEEYISKKLDSTTFNDLTTETQGEYTFLVFSAEITKIDKEGNKYENGISLYFSQGEERLFLDYYISME